MRWKHASLNWRHFGKLKWRRVFLRKLSNVYSGDAYFKNCERRRAREGPCQRRQMIIWHMTATSIIKMRSSCLSLCSVCAPAFCRWTRHIWRTRAHTRKYMKPRVTRWYLLNMKMYLSPGAQKVLAAPPFFLDGQFRLTRWICPLVRRLSLHPKLYLRSV